MTREAEPKLTYLELEQAAGQVEWLESERRELEMRRGIVSLPSPEEAEWAQLWQRWSEKLKRMAEEIKLAERAMEEPKKVRDLIPDELCRKVRHLSPGQYTVVLKYQIVDAETGEREEGYFAVKMVGRPSLQRAISEMLRGMEICEDPPCPEKKILTSVDLFDCLRG